MAESSGHGRLLAGVVVGFGLGWAAGLLPGHGRALQALGPEGVDQSVLTSCVVQVDYNEARKVQIPIEALVYLDYRRGRLVGTMPEQFQIGQQKRVLSNFTERDLVEDFNVEPGTAPRFLISTLSTGAMSDGAQLVAVLETQSRQSRIYKLGFQQSGVDFKPQFSLVERKLFDAKTNVERSRVAPTEVNPASFQPGEAP